MKRITGMVMTAVILSACVAFAQEISVDVDVGDHGSVNGMEEDHRETAADNGTYQAVIQSEEGYEIGEVRVNGELLSEEDRKNISGNRKTTLRLEGVTENVEVSATFEKEGTTAEKEKNEDAGADAKEESATAATEQTDSAEETKTSDEQGQRPGRQAELTTEQMNPSEEKGKLGDQRNVPGKAILPATGDRSSPVIPAGTFIAALLAVCLVLLRFRSAENKRAGVKR